MEPDFPPQCQPENVIRPTEGEKFIRFITTDPLDDLDFKTHAELGRRKPGDSDYCQACTLSLFAPMEKAIKKLQNRVHGQRHSQTQQVHMLHDRVAIADGANLRGKLEAGRKGHYSWWIEQGSERVGVFRLDLIPTVAGEST